MSVLPKPGEKAAYVERMFDTIAPRYDRINRLMTLGLDQGWRQQVVELVAPPYNARMLDVGTGTGDFLPLLAAWAPQGLAVGLDFSRPMMRSGQHKLVDVERMAFVAGDALRLPFADEYFAAITTGFVMRNVTDIGQAFREMWRVAVPGAALACLEVARPQQPWLRLGHRIYFEGLVPRLGGWLGSDRQAYRYLPQSARAFPAPSVLARIIAQAGWQSVRYRRLSMGAVAIHVAIK